MDFYVFLERIMKERGLSIPDVARLSGLSDSTIRSAIDRKQKRVALDVALKLSAGLGISVESIEEKPKSGKGIPRRGVVMGFGNRLQAARLRVGLSRDALAAMLGVSHSAISNYENERSHPKEEIMYKLADALRVDANYLFQDEIPIRTLSPSNQPLGRAYDNAPLPVRRTVEVALEPYMETGDTNIVYVDFRQSEQCASAGTGIYLEEESMVTIKVNAEALPSGYRRAPERYFGVPVRGNSMEPHYHDGDILIVSQEPVNVGEIGVFTMEGEGYVKQLGRGVLHSLNGNYADIPLTGSIRCNGKVIGILEASDLK